MKKYEKDGEDGLTDKRGRSKSEPELASEEKIQRENEAVRARK